MEFAKLKSNLEQALRRLLALCGVCVGPTEHAAVQTDPLGPLHDTPPELWIDAVAFHLGDIGVTCRDVVSDLARLSSAVANSEPWPEEIGSSIWGSVDDMRFHASCFPLYADMIRERLLGSHRVDEGHLVWASSRKRCHPSKLPVKLAADELAASTSLPERETRRIARDLADLDSACAGAQAAIEKFASEPNARLRTLCRRFTNLQCVLLELADILLRADVASALVMYYHDS